MNFPFILKHTEAHVFSVLLDEGFYRPEPSPWPRCLDVKARRGPRRLDAKARCLDAIQVEAMICRVKDEASMRLDAPRRASTRLDAPRRASTRLDAPRRASTHHLDVPRRTSTHLDTLDGLRRFLIRLSVLDMLQYTIKP